MFVVFLGSTVKFGRWVLKEDFRKYIWLNNKVVYYLNIVGVIKFYFNFYILGYNIFKSIFLDFRRNIIFCFLFVIIDILFKIFEIMLN